MNIEMYKIFSEIQKKHWWFIVKKDIVLDMINYYYKQDLNNEILDIGCGSGLMLNSLEKIGITSGLDMSDEAIKFSKSIFSGQVKQGFLPEQVPYVEKSFDIITALDVIEHIDDDIESLRVIRTLLKDNGKAIITVPAYMFLWSGFDELNEHKRRYTKSELKSKLIESGFEIEKISYYNTLLFPIAYIVRKLNNLLNRSGSSDIDMPSKPINFVLKNIFGIEKYLLKFMNLPFGVSLIAVVKK